MKILTKKSGLLELLEHQLAGFFMYRASDHNGIIPESIDTVLGMVEDCFSYSANKYYRENNAVIFNPFHSGQYSIFLYFLSNHIYTRYGDSVLSDKIYCLNKSLNSVDLFYEVTLPCIFSTDHPVGSVIGRATYSDFFFFSQNCTVGNNKGIYPVIGKNVTMFSGAKIIGNSRIGNGSVISANSLVKDQDVPPNSIVFGVSPHLVFKPLPKKNNYVNMWLNYDK